MTDSGRRRRLKRTRTGAVNFRILIVLALLLLVVGWPVYSFVSEKFTGGIHDRGGYKEVDQRAMSAFQLDPYLGKIEDVPPRYRALDGQRVRIEGMVHNVRVEGGKINGFTLVRNFYSAVGPGPLRVQERLYVTAGQSQPLEVEINSHYRVTGTLHVAIKRDGEGEITEVFHLDADQIEPVR